MAGFFSFEPVVANLVSGAAGGISPGCLLSFDGIDGAEGCNVLLVSLAGTEAAFSGSGCIGDACVFVLLESELLVEFGDKVVVDVFDNVAGVALAISTVFSVRLI